ncbi:unnamed protein product [Clonostachys byssicola]|uniref:Uncharacterized protein n=1 Tax=Clonostachys byssicola TaxID=160290 RepID=A0A9N9TWY3_9HYPO|nr:unnamed protein product [Clonostachys byssicola]
MGVSINKFHSRCDTTNSNKVANSIREIAKRAILRKLNRELSVIRIEYIRILLGQPQDIHTGLEGEAKNSFKLTLTGGDEHVPNGSSFGILQDPLKKSIDFQETDNAGMMKNDLWSSKRGIRRHLPDCARGWKFAILSEATVTFPSDDSPIRHRTLGIISEDNPLQVIIIPKEVPRIEITPPPRVESSPAQSWVETEEFGEAEDLTMYDMYPDFFVLDGIEEYETPDYDARNSLQYVLGDWMGDGEISDSSEDEEGF